MTRVQPIRMRIHAHNSGINVAVRITLTGLYDVCRGPLGQRVYSVEAQLSDDVSRDSPGPDAYRFFVKLGDLEDDYGFPLCYADMRRALLWTWLEGRNKPAPERGLTHYERVIGSRDAY